MPSTPDPLPRHALVVGAARSGRAAAAALAGRGRPVRLTDSRADLDVAGLEGVEIAPGARPVEELLCGVDVVVKSPGVPAEAEVVVAARDRGLPVWSEVELGFRLLPAGVRVVGVTGTNGKTTTTELTGAMLRAGDVETVVAGNVGTALSGVAADVAPGAAVVLELSSFQLEDVHSFRADAAALLNVTPDHLDRHGTLAAYAAAKLRLFERQRPADVAVLNVDDPYVAGLGPLPGRGVRVETHGADAVAVGVEDSALRGEHNRQNVAAAAALARALGVGDEAIAAAVRAFRPVPHRLEPIGRVDGVELWNDSKATNVDATLKALTAFPDGAVRILLGGSDKGADFRPLAEALRGRVRAAYLLGPAGRRLEPELERAGVPARRCDRLEPALDAALADARPGEVVLLAPAAASFDEFTGYEERGERFRALARARGAR